MCIRSIFDYYVYLSQTYFILLRLVTAFEYTSMFYVTDKEVTKNCKGSGLHVSTVTNKLISSSSRWALIDSNNVFRSLAMKTCDIISDKCSK